MKVTKLSIPDVLLLEPQVFQDERGFFLESYNQQRLASEAGIDTTFLQDNHSRSARGVLRGLHYQLPPAAQGKLVRVTVGSIFDVAVDIRQASPTFGQWVGQELAADAFNQLWIPSGFAHGFLVLSEFAEVFYKADAYYAPDYERSLRWNDPHMNIQWPEVAADLQLSAKDSTALSWDQAPKFD